MASHWVCLLSVVRRNIINSQSAIGETLLEIRKRFALDTHLGREDVVADDKGCRDDSDARRIDE